MHLRHFLHRNLLVPSHHENGCPMLCVKSIFSTFLPLQSSRVSRRQFTKLDNDSAFDEDRGSSGAHSVGNDGGCSSSAINSTSHLLTHSHFRRYNTDHRDLVGQFVWNYVRTRRAHHYMVNYIHEEGDVYVPYPTEISLSSCWLGTWHGTYRKEEEALNEMTDCSVPYQQPHCYTMIRLHCNYFGEYCQWCRELVHGAIEVEEAKGNDCTGTDDGTSGYAMTTVVDSSSISSLRPFLPSHTVSLAML